MAAYAGGNAFTQALHDAISERCRALSGICPPPESQATKRDRECRMSCIQRVKGIGSSALAAYAAF